MHGQQNIKTYIFVDTHISVLVD